VGEEKGKLIFQIPLVFYNNGAATQVVQNLKLEIEQNNKSAILIFNGTESDLAYQEGSKRLWARQFAIEGRKTYSAVFEFFKNPVEFLPSEGRCKATLKGKLYEKRVWSELLVFPLIIKDPHFSHIDPPYENDYEEGRDLEKGWWQFWR